MQCLVQKDNVLSYYQNQKSKDNENGYFFLMHNSIRIAMPCFSHVAKYS